MSVVEQLLVVVLVAVEGYVVVLITVDGHPLFFKRTFFIIYSLFYKFGTNKKKNGIKHI